ncbi:MAG: hypothetical protein KDB71_09250 [Mycobacterium sp.]|nr:hypothetical protein [Mycobacterium sp.]
MIAVSVAATVWFTQRGSGSQGGSGAGGSQVSADGEIASAGDTGPVGIITEDPTCERLLKMQNQAASQLADWGNRDAAVPASEWTPEQRQMYDTAARILHAEADQLIPLARDTPHRVMRELYEQVIAYDRAYANAIPNYSPSDDDLAVVRNGLGAAQMNICLAIDSYAATNRAPSVQTAAPPTTIAPVGDPGKPQRFLAAPSDACPRLKASVHRQTLELEQWYKTDPNVQPSQRNATDKIVWNIAATVLDHSAGELDEIARSSGNPAMEDFLVLAAQYFRAYVAAIPSYVPADEHLYEVAQKVDIGVLTACSAVQG